MPVLRIYRQNHRCIWSYWTSTSASVQRHPCLLASRMFSCYWSVRLDWILPHCQGIYFTRSIRCCQGFDSINFGSNPLVRACFSFLSICQAGEICLIFYSGLDYTGFRIPVKVFVHSFIAHSLCSELEPSESFARLCYVPVLPIQVAKYTIMGHRCQGIPYISYIFLVIA